MVYLLRYLFQIDRNGYINFNRNILLLKNQEDYILQKKNLKQYAYISSKMIFLYLFPEYKQEQLTLLTLIKLSLQQSYLNVNHVDSSLYEIYKIMQQVRKLK